MGRHKKPDALKELEGTARPDRANFNKPRPDIIIDQDPPDHFTEMERRVWHAIVPGLIRAKLYTTLDEAAIMALCSELSDYYECRAALRTMKVVNVVGSKKECNKEFYKIKQLQQMAWNNARGLMLHFGMTPVARQNLEIAPPDGVGSIAAAEIIPTKPAIE